MVFCVFSHTSLSFFIAFRSFSVSRSTVSRCCRATLASADRKIKRELDFQVNFKAFSEG